MPLTIAHLGQFPAVTISFNLLPGVSLGDAVGRVEELARDTLPGLHPHQFSRDGRGIPVFAARHGSAAGHGHPGDLHGTGDSVRELHPPPHHSLRPALGRFGRPGHAADVPQRAEHLLLRGHYHAGRHRQEERHHDDRLRAGRPAHARACRRRGHLRGLPGALPAHHDDHHGGADGHAAHRPRLRRRRRSAPPAGPGRGRRPGGFAVADALHHPGVLHLHGAVAQPRREEAVRRSAAAPEVVLRIFHGRGAAAISSRAGIPIELRKPGERGRSSFRRNRGGKLIPSRLGSQANTGSLSPVSPAGGALSGIEDTPHLRRSFLLFRLLPATGGL